MTIDHLETRIVILHGPSQQYLQCHTGNAPQLFKSSPGRKVYFLASTGYAKAAGELLQHRTMPCSLALGVKEGASKLLVSEDQPLQLRQTCSQELPLFPSCLHPGTHAETLLSLHVQGNVSFSPAQKKLQAEIRQGNV